jgi:signal transduction histidine kinase
MDIAATPERRKGNVWSQKNVASRDTTELERFARLVAHDLRGPLEVVRHELRRQSTNADPAEDALESLFREKAINSASRVLKVANRVLWYARIATAPCPLQRLNLETPLHDAIEALRNEGDDVPHFTTEVSTLPWVRGDAALLCILFQEIILNAVRYTANAVPQVHVSMAPRHGSGCEVLITDQGTGIPSDDIHRVFELLYRAPCHSHLPGTGVGLAAARRIMTLHGGEMALSSQPGSGTIARLIFPTVLAANYQLKDDEME